MGLIRVVMTFMSMMLVVHLLSSCSGKSSSKSSGGGGGSGGTSDVEVSGNISDDEPLDFVQSSESVSVSGVNLTSSFSYIVGTVIFPDADLKIFMTASLEQRAARRLKQLERIGVTSDLSHDEVMRAIALRDDQDSQRDSAPMRRAEDAVLFDTSDMDVAQAIANLKALLRSKGVV